MGLITMKAVIINGQNHKGSTYNIGISLAEKLADKDEITEFFLPRDLNHFCLGCYSCIKDMAICPYYAEKKVIADAMAEADLLIFTTPNYCMLPSAPMKSFIDFLSILASPQTPGKYVWEKGGCNINNSGYGSRKGLLADEKNACILGRSLHKKIRRQRSGLKLGGCQ